MATFKVGQRVKLVDGPDMKQKLWVGCEVTVLDLPGWSITYPQHYRITRPATEISREFLSFGALGSHLSPLTDPGADRFIESIKKLGREPINEAPKERVK